MRDVDLTDRFHALLAFFLFCPQLTFPRNVTTVALGRDVFAHGVASGDPLEDRVILWTRVSGGRGDVEVHWWVANDPEMRTVIGRGSVVTNSARDFTVKVEASSLRPGTTYYYQFSGLDVPSPIGRTKTLPVGDIDSVRLAVVSCSNLRG